MAIRDLSAVGRIARARSALIVSAPFFACLLMQQELVEDRGEETMAVDGTHLFFNPEFVMGLQEPELIGVLMHEVMHLALLHHTRRGTRGPEDWNRACDYAINPLVLKAGGTLPAGGLISAEFDGLPAEEIYTVLQGRKPAPQPGQDGKGQGQGGKGQDAAPSAGKGQDKGQDAGQGGKPGQGQPQDGQGQGAGQPAPGAGQGKPSSDPGRCGGVRDAAPDQGGMAEAAAKTESMVRQAVSIAISGAGEMPGNLARIMGELNAPRIDWREAVARFVDDAAETVTTWNRPDKRFLESGFYMPGKTRDAVSCVAMFLDTSGSCTDAHVASFASEVQAVLDTGRVQRVHVACIDTRVQWSADYEAGDVIDIQPAGGGGTRFAPAWDHLAMHAPDAAAAIYLTDLDSKHFGSDPGVPVMWCVTGRKRAAPFGEVIPLDPHA